MQQYIPPELIRQRLAERRVAAVRFRVRRASRAARG
jgi:hypothetical protein